MRIVVVTTVAMALMLGGCGGSGVTAEQPIKRQPGSWSSKIEITRLEGPDVKPGQREQMQQMFDMMSKMSVCVTPEAVAKEDMSADLKNKLGGNGACTFDKQDMAGADIGFSGTCKGPMGNSTRITATGKNSATQQEMTVTAEQLDPTGKSIGKMEMHALNSRSGDCKPSDVTPPPAAGNSAG